MAQVKVQDRAPASARLFLVRNGNRTVRCSADELQEVCKRLEGPGIEVKELTQKDTPEAPPARLSRQNSPLRIWVNVVRKPLPPGRHRTTIQFGKGATRWGVPIGEMDIKFQLDRELPVGLHAIYVEMPKGLSFPPDEKAESSGRGDGG